MKKILQLTIWIMFLGALSLQALSSDDVKQAGFDKLTDAQKIEIMQQVNQKVESAPAETAATKVNEWVNVGSNIGKGLAGAAKEVGVAVNDFAKTDVGQLTMYLIVWQIMGGAIVHIFGGILIWIVGFGMIYFYYRKAQIRTEYKHLDNKVTVEYKIGDGTRDAILTSLFTILLAGIIVIFTF